ncbi:uncharacterized protein K460DRAFT_419368 [Cucurbitaria berberidis CBS 394.84]|uniref:SMP-30/Gluconolactonase/LRE-like region domain-containing protein n=1 Tax=Cucurbitaria berberidis CBS 394.84 TaxID=1168544 RepID=A0A9P4GFT3_9PLEO|nr:uncharacterized protein K460DRAFT_419368 [Cucurbitaria berberidis CBS 394.84]KAF1844466.1 hypothetical protein K460DRAFT_419368 [Cucurbitaria berberidis CBS 394.84]
MIFGHLLKTLLPIIFAARAASSLPTWPQKTNTSLINPVIIHQFEPVAWLENLYVRPNGQLLINSQSAPELYLIDPTHPEKKVLIHEFPNTNPGLSGLGGIIETSPDTYAIVLGDLNHTTVSGFKGTFSVWTINLENYPYEAPAVKKVASHPDWTFLNGLTRLEDPTVILGCDSFDGTVYRIDTITGDVSVTIRPDNTTIPPNGQQFFIGIDGIRVFKPRHSKTTFLYYNNYVGQGYYRVPIDAYTGNSIGPVEVLATNLGLGLDDLEIDAYGASWISAAHANRIVRVGPENAVNTVAESPDVRFITAVRQGRTCYDNSRFYFATGQGKVGYIDGSAWL